MSSHEKLSAASNDRKARLAQLKSLKRKQAPTETDEASNDASTALTTTSDSSALTTTEEPSVTTTYLSGRNFDPETRNVKLGFDSLPVKDVTSTLEYKAEQLALETKRQQDAEKAADKPLDLFTLQPKRANWDLKRDLAEKARVLDVWTENAIARLVRERVEGKKDGGMEGKELVEAMHLKEREEEEERKREADGEEDGS